MWGVVRGGGLGCLRWFWWLVLALIVRICSEQSVFPDCLTQFSDLASIFIPVSINPWGRFDCQASQITL